MYEITIQSTFSGAHNLRGYKGKCEALHGHNWRVEVTVISEGLDKIGMVMDFKDLKNKLEGVLKVLDHSHINKNRFFLKNNPTSENIARYIYDEMRAKIKKGSIKKVTVWETDTSSASYYVARD